MKAIQIILSVLLTIILIIGGILISDANEACKVNLEIKEIVKTDSTIYYEIELEKHKYIIRVWGDNLEYSESHHSLECCNY